MSTKEFIQIQIFAAFLLATFVSLGILFGLYQALKCDTACAELKLEQERSSRAIEIEKQRQDAAYMQSDDYKKEQEHRRQIELIKAQSEATQKSNSGEVTIKRETDQVIKDRLLEKGTDLGVNVGLNLLGNFLSN